MRKDLEKLGLGGGCHWCTEAVFQSLKGVKTVEQGYIASEAPYANFSEGILVHFDPEEIPMEILLRIHLLTHKATKDHSMRDKFRSAVYCFNSEQFKSVSEHLKALQFEFEEELVTQALMFRKFESSRPEIQNYYKTDPNRPFCKRFIDPKLEYLQKRFTGYL